MTRGQFLKTLSAAKRGDPQALEEIFSGFYPRVQQMVHRGLSRDLRVSRSWLTSRFSTGDVVQEVFRGLLKDLSGFRGESEEAFTGYLAMLVRNRLMDAVRFHQAAQRDGRRVRGGVEDLDTESSVEGPDAQAASIEEMERFHNALQAFPERDRLLLRARLEQGTTFEELAAMLGYSSKFAARRSFYAAQAQLAIRLSPSEAGGERQSDPEGGEAL